MYIWKHSIKIASADSHLFDSDRIYAIVAFGQIPKERIRIND
jgi:hypothetical protein